MRAAIILKRNLSKSLQSIHSTRGVFVLEVGSEHSLLYESPEDESLTSCYDVPNAAWLEREVLVPSMPRFCRP